MLRSIEINSSIDAQRLNEVASRYNFDIFVHDGNIMIDAKSLLGLMTMVGHKGMKLVFPDDINSKVIDKELRKAKLSYAI